MKLRLRGGTAPICALPKSDAFRIQPVTTKLIDPKEVDELIKAIKADAAKIGWPVALVIVDTLARATPGVDENATKDMGVVVQHCDRIKDALGCTVLPVHHSGKDITRGMRGNNSLDGSADCSIRVTRDEASGVVVVNNQYQKDAEPFRDMCFRGVPIPVTDTRTSLALEPCEAVTSRPLTDQQRAAQAITPQRMLEQADATTLPIDTVARECAKGVLVSRAEKEGERRKGAVRVLVALAKNGGAWTDGEVIGFSNPGTGAEISIDELLR